MSTAPHEAILIPRPSWNLARFIQPPAAGHGRLRQFRSQFKPQALGCDMVSYVQSIRMENAARYESLITLLLFTGLVISLARSRSAESLCC